MYSLSFFLFVLSLLACCIFAFVNNLEDTPNAAACGVTGGATPVDYDDHQTVITKVGEENMAGIEFIVSYPDISSPTNFGTDQNITF